MLRKSKIRNRMRGNMLGERMPQMPGSGSASKKLYPIVSSSRVWWDRNRNVYSDAAGTTPASIDGTIGAWRAVGEGWGTDLSSQSTAANQPVWKSDGVQSLSSDFLTFSTITLVGDFTIYTVASKPNDTNSGYYLSDGTTSNYLGWLGNFAYAFCNATHSVDSLDGYYGAQIRRVRRSGSTWHYKRGGVAEASKAGSSANFPLSAMLTNGAGYMHSTHRLMQVVIVAKLITPGDSDDLAIIAKLQALESGVSGP